MRSRKRIRSAINSVILMDDDAFSPTDIAGLALWLDASDASSITLDGSNNVSQWNDKSGNGRHLSQATTTRRPSYTSSHQMNGINCPRFDGTDDFLQVTGFTIAQAVTHVVAVRLQSASLTYIFDNGVAGADHYFASISGDIRYYAGGTFWQTATGVTTTNANAILMATFNGASSAARWNRAAVAGSGGASNTSGINGFTIGSYRTGAGGKYQGVVGEYLMYSRVLTAGEIASVESYLSAKWGTP